MVLLVLTGLFAVPVAGGLYEARAPEYTCLFDRQVPPANGVDYEWNVQARITPFPLGLECTYIRQSGEEIVVGPGWLLTFFAMTAAAFGLASATAMAWPAPRASNPTRTLG
ncbi:hypothetical protein [Rathayibacter sp. VKM Ac-2760]|uniref:hypothetical protein n=1 Tax=Rathayibacter sp. VKM Ac-2760 TaxID=2609253 RepID=UPI0013182AE9|nr:hypothetical protein [Rathayibacter sp. VKM Ac-2760]QHC61132.1 hypothetical protein GSU72_20580 [Rathayibacter sp. VKM Ac-2760]